MSWRPKLGMFVLTRQEQRAIAFVVLAVLLGLVTQHYRQREPKPSKLPNEIEQTKSTLSLPTPISPRPKKLDSPRRVPPEGRAPARPGPTP